MKFLETHYDDYISSTQNEPLHPKVDKIFKNSLPEKVENLKDIKYYI